MALAIAFKGGGPDKELGYRKKKIKNEFIMHTLSVLLAN